MKHRDVVLVAAMLTGGFPRADHIPGFVLTTRTTEIVGEIPHSSNLFTSTALTSVYRTLSLAVIYIHFPPFSYMYFIRYASILYIFHDGQPIIDESEQRPDSPPPTGRRRNKLDASANRPALNCCTPEQQHTTDSVSILIAAVAVDQIHSRAQELRVVLLRSSLAVTALRRTTSLGMACFLR